MIPVTDDRDVAVGDAVPERCRPRRTVGQAENPLVATDYAEVTVAVTVPVAHHGDVARSDAVPERGAPGGAVREPDGPGGAVHDAEIREAVGVPVTDDRHVAVAVGQRRRNVAGTGVLDARTAAQITCRTHLPGTDRVTAEAADGCALAQTRTGVAVRHVAGPVGRTLELDVDVPARVAAEVAHRTDGHAVGRGGRRTGRVAQMSDVEPADIGTADADVDAAGRTAGRGGGVPAEARRAIEARHVQLDCRTVTACVEVSTPVAASRNVMHRRVAGVAVRPRRVDVGVEGPLAAERHADDGGIVGGCLGLGLDGQDDSGSQQQQRGCRQQALSETRQDVSHFLS